jgi:hypothetical protein
MQAARRYPDCSIRITEEHPGYLMANADNAPADLLKEIFHGSGAQRVLICG